MDVLKKIWFLSIKDYGDKFVLAVVLHAVVACVINIVPFLGQLASLYTWAGLVMLILVKCNVIKLDDAPAAEEDKTEE